MTGHLNLAEAGVAYGKDQPGQDEAVARAFATAADAAGSILWGGHVNLDRPLDNTRNTPIYGLGSGDDWWSSPSVLMLTRDTPAPNTPAIQHGPGQAGPHLVRGITITGPAWGDPQPAGTMPVNAAGVSCLTRGRLEDVRVYGFGSAVVSLNDHQAYRDCNLRGNACAFDFVDNPDGGLGDMVFDHCYLTDQSVASIRISDSACLANARFSNNGHIGAAPVGVLRYKGAAKSRGQALVGVWFDNISFEANHYAAFWDQAGDGDWTNITWAGPADSMPLGNGPTVPGWPDPSALGIYHVGRSAQGFRWLGGGMPAMPGKATISAQSMITDVMVDSYSLEDVVSRGLRPLEVRDPYSEWGQEFGAVTLGRGARFSGDDISTVRTAHENIKRGDLVEPAGATHVARWRGGQVVGVSANDYRKGEACVHASQFGGWGMGVRNASTTATLQQGDLIMPDPDHVGGVKKATALEKAIGYVNDAAIGPASFGRAAVTL